MDKKGLKDYLIEEAEINQRNVEEMTAFEMIDAWLKYNGVIGYTEEIIDVIQAATETEINEEKLFSA